MRQWAFLGSLGGGGGLLNAFVTIQTPFGTFPSASGADTETFTSSDNSVIITGDAGSKNVDFITVEPTITIQLLQATYKQPYDASSINGEFLSNGSSGNPLTRMQVDLTQYNSYSLEMSSDNSSNDSNVFIEFSDVSDQTTWTPLSGLTITNSVADTLITTSFDTINPAAKTSTVVIRIAGNTGSFNLLNFNVRFMK